MPRFSANLSMLFQDLPLPDRLARAAANGFSGVEVLFPYADLSAGDIAVALQATGLTLVLINAPPGDWAAGQRGLAALPGHEGAAQASITMAVDYARATGCTRIHVMAGLLPQDVPLALAEETFVANLRHACALAGDIAILIEPLNTLIDVPGYVLDSTDQALRIIDRVGAINLKLQFDIYHMHIMERAGADRIATLLPHIGHIQLADHPGRHEPGTGEIDFGTLLPALDEMGYDGWVGCEYRERLGLGWAAPWLGGGALPPLARPPAG